MDFILVEANVSNKTFIFNSSDFDFLDYKCFVSVDFVLLCSVHSLTANV